MLKKILFFIILLPIAFISLKGYNRFKSNIEQFFPYSYYFLETSPQDSAPIAILGDELGARFYSFKDLIIEGVSKNLSKPIKVSDLTQKKQGLQRSLNLLKNLQTKPKILIYFSGLSEFTEKRFNYEDLGTIKYNFSIYNDPLYQTILLLYQKSSRLLYKPLTYVEYDSVIKEDETKYSDFMLMKRNEFVFKYYKQELTELIEYTKTNDILLFLITTPLNPEVSPFKSCEGTLDPMFKDKFIEFKKLVENKNYKLASELGKELSLLLNSHAETQFYYAKTLKNLGQNIEAYERLIMAKALDCNPKGANPVFNSIMRSLASEKQVPLIDFERLLLQDWNINEIFLDDVYPQNIYFEKLIKPLSYRIKDLLKL